MGEVKFSNPNFLSYWGKGAGRCIGIECSEHDYDCWDSDKKEGVTIQAIRLEPLNTRGKGNLNIEIPKKHLLDFIHALEKLL